MRASSLLRSGALFLMVLGACAPVKPTVPETKATSTDEVGWTITLRQSGGFVGVDQTVTVTSDGQLVTVDRRSGKRATTKVPPESLAEISRLFGEAASADRTPHASACADCFKYDLELVSTAKSVQINLDDTTLGDSHAHALILSLIQLRDAALATH